MSEELPPTWRRESTDPDRPDGVRSTTYVHESGDVRLRVVPTSLEVADRPGYELSVTTYPGLEFASRTVVRTTTTYGACERLAGEFVSLFEGRYERPADVETPVEYATAHLRPSAANDDAVVPPERRAD